VSITGHFAGTIAVDQITGYEPPAEGDAERVKAATKLAPLANFPGAGFVEMTSDEWKGYSRASAGWTRVAPATATTGAYRYRSIYRGGSTHQVFISDAKRVDPPALAATPKPMLPDRPLREVTARRAPSPTEDRAAGLRAQLRAGVAVVSAPELFPTPSALALRMVDLAEVSPGHVVLEPSAGTGAIVAPLLERGAHVIAIERNDAAARMLERAHGGERCRVVCEDFLAAEASPVDRVVMNPPFSADIAHVRHAFARLVPGGRLVAVMSAGVRFRQDQESTAFRALVDRCGHVEDLPEGTFKESGTSVRTVLVTLEKGAAA